MSEESPKPVVVMNSAGGGEPLDWVPCVNPDEAAKAAGALHGITWGEFRVVPANRLNPPEPNVVIEKEPER